MAAKQWAPEGTKELFMNVGDLKNIHPAVRYLCSAVVDLCNVRTTSMIQQENMINAFCFIIRAINSISDYDGTFSEFKIEDPYEAAINRVLGEAFSEQEVLQFPNNKGEA